MRTLVIDCATPALSLALFDDEICIAAEHTLIGRGHAEALVPRIAALPGGGRADAVAVDVGPGSFTGIRVGIAAARGLGFAWSVPVTGYGCLSLCAAIARHDGPSPHQPITLVMIGGHGEFFWQRFDPLTAVPFARPASHDAATLAQLLDTDVLHGSGAAAIVEMRGWGTAIDCLPDARGYGLLDREMRALPPIALYGRGADAKPMAGEAL